MKRPNQIKITLYLPERATHDLCEVAASLAFRFPLTNQDRPSGRTHCAEYVFDRVHCFFFVVVWWTKSRNVCARAWVEPKLPEGEE